ncbi:hypothetical protein AArcMg_4081 (plasmid) [Natrarchaeobaculum sulfurireducens]|uniref:Uncharacterized protein n=1 Tax=Natrarchaeobaculum sulfurireducens TaxID=2044521 RepID=A0A346PK61_9EURY|nr:hypothetical protein AArcMg_4081 [Natrarchaeobaculum sulfurireducens]
MSRLGRGTHGAPVVLDLLARRESGYRNDHLGTSLVEDILETALDESDLSVVTFESQFVTDEGVPDAVIRTSTSLFIETKTQRNAVDRAQLKRHLAALDDDSTDTQRLIVLTPDATEPAAVDELEDERLVWMSFDGLVSALEGVLSQDETVAPNKAARRPSARAFSSVNSFDSSTSRNLRAVSRIACSSFPPAVRGTSTRRTVSISVSPIGPSDQARISRSTERIRPKKSRSRRKTVQSLLPATGSSSHQMRVTLLETRTPGARKLCSVRDQSPITVAVSSERFSDATKILRAPGRNVWGLSSKGYSTIGAEAT